MLDSLVKKFVGSRSDREIKKIQPKVVAINELELSVSSLTDEELQFKTAEFKQRIENGESLDATDSKPPNSSNVSKTGKAWTPSCPRHSP